MANIYENVIEEFNKRNCKLLTTKEQHNEISKNKQYKLNYVASCGHEHNVFFNVFKSRDTGVICPACKNKQIGNNKKEKIKNNEKTKINTIEQEFGFITNISEFLKNDFEVIKAFDGCNVDIIFRPKNIIDDIWVGIQVKTTNVRHLTYSFHINNIYKDCLLLFYCCEDESMWLIPENIIGNQTKVSIGYNKSKYNIYKTCKNTIISKLNELYNITSKFKFDILNLPINIYQKREQEFIKYRESKIDFIKFDYYGMEATVYDFKIDNLKVQEKVTKKCEKENRYKFCICKNNGIVNKKSIQIQYDIGDNDLYWLNCEDKKYFFVIPEKYLAEKGIIGNNGIRKSLFLKITIQEKLHKNSSWLQNYMFNYETINEDVNKNRLLDLLNFKL
jgi:hypothetical protein